GFTISTEVCTYYYNNNKSLPEKLKLEIKKNIKKIENFTKMKFGSNSNPLLLSVRSGSRASMPGMMDTILNLGLNNEAVKGLAKSTKNERFAFDSYRRFIQMYSDVVLEIDNSLFEDALEDIKIENGYSEDTELTPQNLKDLTETYKKIVLNELNRPFPQDPSEQLWGAISAVFSSWMNNRAITYRKLNNLPSSWGTAVNIQSMVFGNMGEDCATGVAFTRNPNNGEDIFYGEYLINAQGEDVVAGIRTPYPLSKDTEDDFTADKSLEVKMPKIYDELLECRSVLEKHYGDMQDIEFTVQDNKLFLLQTRNGKRTAEAAIKIAVDMVYEGKINTNDALIRVEPESLNQLLHPTLDNNAKSDFLIRGMPASPGAVSGKIVLESDDAVKLSAAGESVILVRLETSPEDIAGMHAASGILTSRGGMTSHAAVVARGMGRACITGANELRIDFENKIIFFGEKKIKSGAEITIDGSSGNVYLGQVPTVYPEMSESFVTLMKWADKLRRLKVRTNAETPNDAKTAIKFGAEGIGLCRTEHMFFDENRINVMRQMILAEDSNERENALDKLLPMQRKDFEDLFLIMKGLPVTIRLLDPPLHEFLPNNEKDMISLSSTTGISLEKIKEQSLKLHEANPMLGHRGCRLAVSYPEICEMQSKAIFEAAVNIQKKINQKVNVEIMIPLASTSKEIDICKEIIDKVASTITIKMKEKIDYLVGTMIELPRAALCADQLASSADFFSFGTNDLTQTTFGISRDDIGNFLNKYLEDGIFQNDPFISIDKEAVGSLLKIGVKKGKETNKFLKLGVCGEHGGDPNSIDFFEEIGLDYISASPFRIPIARLAAAQSIIKKKN
ncbi:pyruvate, phosphate dikinase, partial [SAR116 cluster bacterium]|nr:pyruvate, phosphate dikinase [SAR116 cluster bacterium]